LTIDELKNSDFVKMKNREAKRNILIATIVALLIICALIYILRPQHFNNDIFPYNNVSIDYVKDTLYTVYDKDGEPLAETGSETKNLSFSRESTEFQQIKKILEKYSYHICFNTLKGIADTVTSGSASIYNNDQTILINTGKDVIMITNVPYIIVGGNVYRIGYFGNSKMSELFGELKDVLKIK